MITNTINPVLIQIGNFSVYWYGLFAAIGTLIAILLIKKLLENNEELKDKTDKYIIATTLSIIIGARLFSILSNITYYLENPLKALSVWEGGLAYHGGLILTTITLLILTKKDKLTKNSILKLSDVIFIGTLPVIILGRIGNFINKEFYGTITTLPWGVIFQNIPGARHPVQIYESITYIIILLIIWKLKNKNPVPGVITAIILISYGITRFILEYFKASEAVTHISILTWGQFWSIPMIIVGVVMLTRISQRFKNKKNKL